MVIARPTPDEAALLLHAMCSRLGRDTGIPVLAIKGPAVAMQHLRRHRSSADVDVLVHPDGFEDFVAALIALGWSRAVEDTTPKAGRLHSVDLVHLHWPLGIDVHLRFPGFLGDDQEVFDELWARRTTVDLAGAPVATCDVVSHVAVVGLHLLRMDPEGRSLRVADLIFRAESELGPDGIESLEGLARRTDCLVPLRPILLGLGVAPIAITDTAHPDELRAWFARGYLTPGATWGWQLRRTPWWRWPGLIWHAVTLTDAEIATHHGGGGTRRGRAMARLRRLRKLPRLWPGILRGLVGGPLGRRDRR